MESLFPLILLFGLMWVLLIRPQQRRVRQHQQVVASLVEGDEVVTTGGLIGTVDEINEEVLTVEVAPGVQIKMLRSAVQSRIAGPDDGDPDDGDPDELGPRTSPPTRSTTSLTCPRSKPPPSRSCLPPPAGSCPRRPAPTPPRQPTPPSATSRPAGPTQGTAAREAVGHPRPRRHHPRRRRLAWRPRSPPATHRNSASTSRAGPRWSSSPARRCPPPRSTRPSRSSGTGSTLWACPSRTSPARDRRSSSSSPA